MEDSKRSNQVGSSSRTEYSRATYANALFVYHVVGMTKEEEQMLSIIKNTYDLNKEPRPLQA
ncbi:hypothetical protein DRN41_05365, partial [Thermococci archaeon]